MKVHTGSAIGKPPEYNHPTYQKAPAILILWDSMQKTTKMYHTHDAFLTMTKINTPPELSSQQTKIDKRI